VYEEIDPEFEDVMDVPGMRLVTHALLEHPIPANPGDEARANAELQKRRDRLVELKRAGDWEGMIRLHNADHWSRALLRHGNKLTDPIYWRLAGEFFREHMWTSLFTDDWRRIFDAARPGRRENLMTDDERTVFDALDEVVTVMRGFRVDAVKRGLSWTRTRRVAEKFAHDAHDSDGAPPQIAHGVVERDKVIVVFLVRGEDEIVALPEDVRIVRTEILPSLPGSSRDD
jgi:hypothetical protein